SPAAGSRGLSVTHQLEARTEWLRSRLGSEGFIAYFQTYSGTYAPVARLKALYEEALAFPGVVGLAIGTRPDCLEPETVELLDDLSRRAYVSLELGLQSAFDETLRRVNRAHGFAEFAAAMDLCRGRGFEICIHLIVGLPGEGPPHWRETAAALGRWDYHSLKIHPLHVVRGTALARQYDSGLYIPLERKAYVEGLVDILECVPPSVGVQRFTGDAAGDLLVAPDWCRDKAGLREDMLAEFRRRGTRQGHRIEVGDPVLQAVP
ncbi:MAG TPA: TIGR01212 family radical SAM protein, partial [Fibrobacteria bacterium]|nr:TIGR01212 family radical SAM protein [Fibrobacteria bacterium]